MMDGRKGIVEKEREKIESIRKAVSIDYTLLFPILSHASLLSSFLPPLSSFSFCSLCSNLIVVAVGVECECEHGPVSPLVFWKRTEQDEKKGPKSKKRNKQENNVQQRRGEDSF